MRATIYLIGLLMVLAVIVTCSSYGQKHPDKQRLLMLAVLVLFILFHAIRRSTGLM